MVGDTTTPDTVNTWETIWVDGLRPVHMLGATSAQAALLCGENRDEKTSNGRSKPANKIKLVEQQGRSEMERATGDPE